MKKIFLFVLGMSVIFCVQAQDSGYKQIDVKLDGKKMSQAMTDVGNVDVNFCEKPGEKSVVYDVLPGEKKKFCYVFSNFSDQDVDVHVSFVDGTFTNDEWKHKACKEQGQMNDFGQYVTEYQGIVHIPAHGKAQYFASLQLPETFTGVRNGCLTYYIGGVEVSEGVNFTVLMRRAKFIDVHLISSTEYQISDAKYRFMFFVLFVLGVGIYHFMKTKKH